MRNRGKIGFIFIDEIHHIYHFITIAIALAKEKEVSIITFPAKHIFLRKELNRLGGENVKIEKLSTDFFTNIIEKISKKKIPRASVWMKKNRNYIAENFDAIVFSDFIHHKFLQQEKIKQIPPIFKLAHGLPGRSRSYKKDLKDFDYQFLFGPFHLEEFKKRNLLAKDYKMIGFPKLEAINSKQKKNFFNNKKNTVIYAPHFNKEYSSWYSLGRKILEYFYHQVDYNLIFAPHIQLFNSRKGISPEEIDQKFFNCSHMHIDLGSQNSVDMTYMNSANIYLGDVSSQVYEFIIQPRPCIFINVNNISWQENIDFRFWKCGDVVENITELKKALNVQQKKFQAHYIKIQEKINTENFYSEPNSTASERAANAIIEFLE